MTIASRSRGRRTYGYPAFSFARSRLSAQTCGECHSTFTRCFLDSCPRQALLVARERITQSTEIGTHTAQHGVNRFRFALGQNVISRPPAHRDIHIIELMKGCGFDLRGQVDKRLTSFASEAEQERSDTENRRRVSERGGLRCGRDELSIRKP